MDRRVAEATKSCQSGKRARVDTSYRDKLVETQRHAQGSRPRRLDTPAAAVGAGGAVGSVGLAAAPPSSRHPPFLFF